MKNHNNGQFITSRTFSSADCIKFAELSQDFNDIHLLSPKFSSANFSNQINHGVNSLLWALESFYIRFNYLPKKIHTRFKQPVHIDEEVNLYWDSSRSLLSILDLNDKILVSIVFFNKLNSYEKSESNKAIAEILNQPRAKEVLFEELKLGKKNIDLYPINSKMLPLLFPNLTNFIGEAALSSIIYISQIVGMHLPGKYSILNFINLEFIKNITEKSIDIIRADERTKYIIFDFTTPSVNACVGAFFRPKPVDIQTIHNIDIQKAHINIPKGRKILVIGGSSGIGALVSKVLARNGADVTITYHQQKEAAESIRDNLSSQGFVINILHFSIPEGNSKIELEQKFESIYYFATPLIRSSFGAFNQELYEEYYYYYVSTFVKLIDFFNSDYCKRIFFPSSILLDKPKPGLREYIMAKSQGELVCSNAKPRNKLKIKVLRVEAVFTNNTNNLIPLNFSDPVRETIRIINYVELDKF
jgi:hypothetical protein